MSAVLERVTVTMPTEMTAVIKQVVDDGEYASTSEVVREAVRAWKTRRQLMQGELAALRADIHQGLADLAAGRVEPVDVEAIIAQGRAQLAARSN